jgi:signal transduction histidine kinase
MVCVTFADSGCGIDRDKRSEIFDPFFTTKHDVGNGLGLWVTSQIVEKHRGSIRMRSRTEEPWRGTTFSVAFPI